MVDLVPFQRLLQRPRNGIQQMISNNPKSPEKHHDQQNFVQLYRTPLNSRATFSQSVVGEIVFGIWELIV